MQGHANDERNLPPFVLGEEVVDPIDGVVRLPNRAEEDGERQLQAQPGRGPLREVVEEDTKAAEHPPVEVHMHAGLVLDHGGGVVG